MANKKRKGSNKSSTNASNGPAQPTPAGGTSKSPPAGAGKKAGLKQDVRLYFIHAHSPVHLGVGEGFGDINLPIAREVHTGCPFIPGSSVKGILRDAAEQVNTPKRNLYSAFGPPKEHAGDARGGLVISDASLLCLPVRSLVGTFAWVTCPLALRRLERDSKEAGFAPPIGSLASASSNPKCDVPPGSALVHRGKDGTLLFLEEAALRKEDGGWTETGGAATLADWIATRAWPGDEDQQGVFQERFLVVPDDVFGYLHRYATEVRSRVKIDPSRGTAADSGPWNEEYLPAESLLFGVVIGRTTVYVNREQEKAGETGGTSEQDAGDDTGSAPQVEPCSPKDVVATLESILQGDPLLRVGGKSTGGSGRVHIRLVQ